MTDDGGAGLDVDCADIPEGDRLRSHLAGHGSMMVAAMMIMVIDGAGGEQKAGGQKGDHGVSPFG
ncbi:hypothetical protein MACH15_22780 [Maricaulis maris]|nr:hypothetical protein MACH15_22780 [Maricaulis maris]